MNIFEKLLKIQQEARVTKDMHNDFGRFNYRNAEMIFEALKPICLKYGAVLRVTDDVEEKCGRPYIKAIAELIDIETQGEIYAISSVGWARIPEQKKGMDDSQLTGSTSSYARKYALGGLFCLDDNKDADALPPDDKYEQAKEKQEAMERNQAKLDATENWRLTNEGIEVKGQKGFVPITKLSVEQLEAIAKMRKFADVKADIEREIANR